MNQITINSKHVTDSIESQIIQLYNVVKIEHSCDHDAAREHIRRYLSKKHNECMSPDATKMVADLKTKVMTKIKKKHATEDDRLIYKLLTYLGL